MKFELNINQKAWAEYVPDANITHAIIYEAIKSMCMAKNMDKRDNYTRITLKKIVAELPLLISKSKGSISRAVAFLEEKKLVRSITPVYGGCKYYIVTAYSLNILRLNRSPTVSSVKRLGYKMPPKHRPFHQ